MGVDYIRRYKGKKKISDSSAGPMKQYRNENNPYSKHRQFGNKNMSSQSQPASPEALIQPVSQFPKLPKGVTEFLDAKEKELSQIIEGIAVESEFDPQNREEFFEHITRLMALKLMKDYRVQVLSTRIPTMYGEGYAPTLPHDKQTHMKTMEGAMSQLRQIVEYLEEHEKALEILSDLLSEAKDLDRLVRKTNPKSKRGVSNIFEVFGNSGHIYQRLESRHVVILLDHLSYSSKEMWKGNPHRAWNGAKRFTRELQLIRKKQKTGAEFSLIKIYQKYPIFITLKPSTVTKEETNEELRLAAAKAFIDLQDNIQTIAKDIAEGDIHPFDLPRAVEVTKQALPHHLKNSLEESYNRRQHEMFWRDLAMSLLDAAVGLIPVIGPVLSLMIAGIDIGMRIEDLEDRWRLEKISSAIQLETGQTPLGNQKIPTWLEVFGLTAPVLAHFGISWIGRGPRPIRVTNLKEIDVPQTKTRDTVKSQIHPPKSEEFALSSIQEQLDALPKATPRQEAIKLPRKPRSDPRWLPTQQEQLEHLQFSPPKRQRGFSRQSWRKKGMLIEPPKGGGSVSFGPRIYKFNSKGELIEASTNRLTLGVRDKYMYKEVALAKGEDFGHLLGIDASHIDAQLGKYGGFPQKRSSNQSAGHWFRAERDGMRLALELERIKRPYRYVALARGHVNGIPTEARIIVESAGKIYFDSGWIPW